MSNFIRVRARSVAVGALSSSSVLGAIFTSSIVTSAITSALVAPMVSAQTASTAATAEPVVVTATRTPQRVDQTLAQVTVIDRARIEAATGRTLAELLATESGVQFWSNGGLGKSASVSLRGLESRHTLLLIDGVRYGSATLGTPVWDNIPLDSIERIEIVRGPMSGVYGSDAVGGVIQIFTRRGQQGFKPEVTATLGTQSYGEVAAGARFGTGVFDGSLRLQHRRTDGFSATNSKVPFNNHNPDDDGFDQSSINGRFGVQLGKNWRAEATFLKSEGTNYYDDGPGANTRAELRSEVLSAKLSGLVTGPWRTSIQLARSRDDFETLASASSFTTLGTIGTTQTQFSWENQIATPFGTALILADRVEQEVKRPGTPFAVSARTIAGVALGLNGEAGPHGWQVNLRRDRNSQFGARNTSLFGYGYTFAPGLRATASFGSSFVVPSFNQLYFPGFGNPNLLPEEGRQREFGLQWNKGPVTSRLVYFDNRIRGYISSGPLPTNVPRVKISGLSVSANARLGAWTISGGIDSIEPINATEGTANFGRILPRRVQDSLRLALDWRSGALTLGGSLQAHGSRFDNASNSVALPGYGTLDLRAEWALARDWTLAAKLNNVLDKKYETVFGYNQPGREAYVTLRWTPR